MTLHGGVIDMYVFSELRERWANMFVGLMSCSNSRFVCNQLIAEPH